MSLEAELRLAHGSALERFYGFAESWRERRVVGTAVGQAPDAAMFPGLRAQPFWDEASPLRSTLVAHYEELMAELVMQPPRVFEAYPPSLRYEGLGQGAWTACRLFTEAGFTEASRPFPRARALIESLAPQLIGEVAYLALAPGARLPPHADQTNAQLTCHLGMIVPEGATLEVAGIVRTWREGEALIFDPSFVHSACNESDKARIVLLLDVAHPDLTVLELAALRAAVALGIPT